MKGIRCAGLFLLLIFSLTSCENKLPEFTEIMVYPVKNPLPEFELIRHDNAAFTRDSLTGRWSILFMGYTHCPDVCPLTLSDVTGIYQKLSTEQQQRLEIVFLSVDPKRDTTEHLAGYIKHFHDDFAAISGQKEQIDKLVYGLGGIYAINNEDPTYYTVDHSARLFIVNPAGERFGIVSSEAMHNKDKTQLVKELSQLLDWKMN